MSATQILSGCEHALTCLPACLLACLPIGKPQRSKGACCNRSSRTFQTGSQSFAWRNRRSAIGRNWICADHVCESYFCESYFCEHDFCEHHIGSESIARCCLSKIGILAFVSAHSSLWLADMPVGGRIVWTSDSSLPCRCRPCIAVTKG